MFAGVCGNVYFDPLVRHDFDDFAIKFAGRNIEWVPIYDWLGILVDSNLKFSKHKIKLADKFQGNLFRLNKFSHKYFGASRTTLNNLYNGSILPLIMYCTHI